MNLNGKETFIVVSSLILGFTAGTLTQMESTPRYVTLLILLLGLIVQRIVIWVNWEEQ